MSRSGYSDDGEDDNNTAGLYRHAVARATYGKRGQTFLQEMASALDAMPVKELIDGDIVRGEGQVCAIGAVAVARKMDVTKLDIYDQDAVAKMFGVAPALAREIAYENDDDFGYRHASETPAQRWKRMREWVAAQLLRGAARAALREPSAAVKGPK